MTDETERGKLDKGLRSIYSQMPVFHLGFLDEILTEEAIERGLSCCTKSSKERAMLHNRVVSSRLGLRLSIQEVIGLMLPIVYSSCLSYQQALEPESFLNNPERVFVRDIIELVRQGYLIVDHLSASELDHRRSIKAFTEKYPKAVINLEEVEKVSFRLRNTISQRIIKVWRQYLDLQEAELKQAAIQTEPDGLPYPWLLSEPKRRGRRYKMMLAAYKEYRKVNKGNPETLQDMHKFLTPESLPEHIAFRSGNDDISRVVLRTKEPEEKVTEWSIKSFKRFCEDYLKLPDES